MSWVRSPSPAPVPSSVRAPSKLPGRAHSARPSRPGPNSLSGGPAPDRHDHEQAAARGLDASPLHQAAQSSIDGDRTAASNLLQVAASERVAICGLHGVAPCSDRCVRGRGVMSHSACETYRTSLGYAIRSAALACPGHPLPPPPPPPEGKRTLPNPLLHPHPAHRRIHPRRIELLRIDLPASPLAHLRMLFVTGVCQRLQ